MQVINKSTFDLENFIPQYITNRSISLLKSDLTGFEQQLVGQLINKSALVIGGAGTIGSSFIKAVLKFGIKKLYIIDTNESGLAELVRDCRSTLGVQLPDDFKTYPIDFGSKVFYKLLDKEPAFDIVANFAAHKHVRSEKDVFSIEAMFENNVIKNQRLLEKLSEKKPQHFFCVSTDKAANPVNIMGASKKMMEDLILAYSTTIPITTARFANVAFSNGSLLAGFIERVNKKQPLSCPSDIRRYFVSPQESGELCMLACMLGKSGEIFFPKLKEATDLVNFKDIAIHFLQALGYTPDICATELEAKEKATKLKPRSKKYPIYFFTSDTAGEKHYEEFYTGIETIDWDRFNALGVITDAPKKSIEAVKESIQEFEKLVTNDLEKADVVRFLNKYIPDFQHIETGKNLDQKM